MSKTKTENPMSDKRLVRNVALTLACKIAVIACLGFLFFGADNRVSTDAESVSRALLTPAHTSATASQVPKPE